MWMLRMKARWSILWMVMMVGELALVLLLLALIRSNSVHIIQVFTELFDLDLLLLEKLELFSQRQVVVVQELFQRKRKKTLTAFIHPNRGISCKQIP